MKVFNQFRYLFPALRRVKAIFTLVALLTLLASAVGLLPPYLTKLVIDRGVTVGEIDAIIYYGLLAIAALLLSSVLEYAKGVLSSIAGIRLITDLRSQSIERLMQMRVEFFDKHKSGYLAEQLNQVNHLGAFVSPIIFEFFGNLIQALGTLAIMLQISVEITAVALPFMLLFFFIMYKTSTGIKETSEELMETSAQMHGSLQEMISGISEVKQSTAEGKKSGEATRQFESIANQEIKQSIFMGIGFGSIPFLTSLAGIVVLILSGIFITRGELTMGDYVALSGYIMILFAPALLGGNFVLTIQPAIVALKRLKPIFEEKTERELGGNKTVSKLEGAVSFDNVTFAYESGKEPILKDCSFSIAPGECVAILGKNGAGKSTLIKLMLGFYAQYNGRILIDGYELHGYDVISLRRRVGIVSQNIVLFTGSLWENVKMANLEASDEKVEQALALSGCNDIFDGDLNKVHIAESGKTMSGGQKQAVAIARCLLKDPDVLIFDEATAHLDTSTRESVMHALKHVFSNKTRILITHDREIAKFADNILFLEGGFIKSGYLL